MRQNPLLFVTCWLDNHAPVWGSHLLRAVNHIEGKVEIPKALLGQIQEGRAVLFLGAGAAIGAQHPANKTIPTGAQLQVMLADEFLGEKFRGRPLDTTARLAISETDLQAVQQFVCRVFESFNPAPFHLQLPAFVWRDIFTTNYDLIIERAYSQPGRLQDLVPFFSDNQRVDDRLRTDRSLAYIKLHGCISSTNDERAPLILTPEQYISHKSGRERLFARFEESLREHPIIYVGHSLSDPDLLYILHRFQKLGSLRPRSYVVSPHMSAPEKRYWEGERISPLEGTLQEFLSVLDARLPKTFRGLAATIEQRDQTVLKHMQRKPADGLTNSLQFFFSKVVDHVDAGMATEEPEPRTFYRGYFSDWSPIVANLDARRTTTMNRMLKEIVLPNDCERRFRQELFLLKGHAGAGKSVLLRRVAWQAAVEHRVLCLYVKQPGLFEYEHLLEVAASTQKRIFLFLDPAGDCVTLIPQLLEASKRDDVPLTIVTAERHNEWNTQCSVLQKHVVQEYELRYLSRSETEALVELLAEHKSLGHLERLSHSDRVRAFEKRAGRQLLVALHEATSGKPFAEIVLDEYNGIPEGSARDLYRTVCILHRLGVPARAGLISRVHGIPFSAFEERLFTPLQFVVFARAGTGVRDHVYVTRHPHIAELVFEQTLLDEQHRLEEYLRVITRLDVGYQVDAAGLRGLMKANELIKLFSFQNAKRLFSAAKQVAPEDHMLFQQEAILEMKAREGDLERAAELLQDAVNATEHQSPVILHSIAELALRRAKAAESHLVREKALGDMKVAIAELLKMRSQKEYAYHTVLRSLLWQMRSAFKESEASRIEALAGEFQVVLARAIEDCPSSSYVRDAESRFRSLLRDSPGAIIALKKAWQADRSKSLVAIRLARLHATDGDLDSAIAVLKQCVDAKPADKDAHFELGMLLNSWSQASNEERLHHFRAGFTQGDKRYAQQFWFLRALFLSGDEKAAAEGFRKLGNRAEVDVDTKLRARGRVSGRRYRGVVEKVGPYFTILRLEGSGTTVFAHRSSWPDQLWEKVKPNVRVQFALAFSFRGPVAESVRWEDLSEL